MGFYSVYLFSAAPKSLETLNTDLKTMTYNKLRAPEIWELIKTTWWFRLSFLFKEQNKQDNHVKLTLDINWNHFCFDSALLPKTLKPGPGRQVTKESRQVTCEPFVYRAQSSDVIDTNRITEETEAEAEACVDWQPEGERAVSLHRWSAQTGLLNVLHLCR